jgi:hypothetical protein
MVGIDTAITIFLREAWLFLRIRKILWLGLCNCRIRYSFEFEYVRHWTAAAYLNTDSLGNPRTDFDNIAQAETQPTAYSQDVAGSAFTGWYDYDDVWHTLKSNKHVYLLRIGNDIFKMQLPVTTMKLMARIHLAGTHSSG